MKILVTGGLGFIGSHFSRLALKDGHDVSILDKLTYAGDLSNVSSFQESIREIVILDIGSPETIEYLASNDFEIVVNFAAESHVDRSIKGGIDFAKSNILGVVNLLEAQKKGLFQRLIQVSTDEVYGSIVEGSWSEQSPLDPRSPYSASKASAELICNSYSATFGLSISITRCANNFGPFQSVEKLIPVAISNLVKGESVPVYGNGLNIREWLHVEDHVTAILSVMNSGFDDVYNIGGTAVTNIDLVREIVNYLDKSDEMIRYVPDRLGHDFRYSLDDSKIRQKLGWAPRIDFAYGLRNTIDWYQANPDWITNSITRLSK